ncbi:S-ribosylhomocysteinase [Bacillus thuringiensis serovar andalousiensis]|uniref:S-ribosylhomocysteinase n=2 Tax=Bacillus TaxID=1386 RepID=A0A9X6Q073_BACTU|nr:S-ribosylhomocysteinase [Bacillus thuringiensis serovar andalousiensis]OTZ12446.1 S-ribosylhomocysteinase [Bacillus thuringiensis serovar aizawai]OTZ94240.1 S-ribosylhomocysteinase [Bacillus thuringiensis]
MQHNMYAVKLLFESVHCSEPDPTKIDEHYEENNDTLFEESIILVKANNLEDAHELGKKIAMQSEDTYDNMYGEQITWKFRKVLHVFELDDTPFETGKELYARFLHVKKDEMVNAVVQKYYPEYE